MINQDLPYNEEIMWDDKDQAEQTKTKSRRYKIQLLGIPEREKEDRRFSVNQLNKIF